MEGGTAEREGARGRRVRGKSRLKDRLSFGATLVSVAAIAISIGWMIGQYAIQTVTGPRLVAENFERPEVTDVPGAGQAMGGPAVGSGTGSGTGAGTGSGAAGGSGSGGTATSGAPSAASSVTAPAASGSATPATSPAASPAPSGFWRVQAGAFSDKARADALVSDLRARGFDAAVVAGAEPVPYRVQVGAFREESRARGVVDDLRAAGFEAALFAPTN